MAVEIIITVGLILYAISILRFIEPLKHFKKTAERLGVDINAVTQYPQHGPEIIQETAKALALMQSRLQQLMDNRSKMVASISHDLRTLLTRLKLRVELLEPCQATGKIKSEIVSMEYLIANILWFASHDAQHNQQKPLNLSSLLQDICDDSADVGHPVTFKSKMNDVVVLGHLESLKRVFNNLIDNALKYSAYQPVLVKLNKDKDDKVLIEIDDCGPGVREGDLDHMMQAFYRGQDEQYKVTGAGLGLAIVQEIVEEHSGQIAFHNLRTKGLRAKVILPLFNHIVHE